MKSNMNQAIVCAADNDTVQSHKTSLSERLFSTNWGLAIIGGLLALAIGAATLHNGYVESRAQEVPEVEIETVMPASAS